MYVGIHTCLSFRVCAHVCVHACVHAGHRQDSDLIPWSPSLTHQHPASHVVHLHTFSLLSGNLFTHIMCTLLHMYVVVCACVCFFKSLILCEFATQTSGRSSARGCYPPAPPFCLLPDRNKLVPDVLLTITPRSFLTSSVFLVFSFCVSSFN